MAKVVVTFGRIAPFIPQMDIADSEVLTSGAASVASTKASSQRESNGGAVIVTAVDGNVWVTSGEAPVAAVGTGHYVLTGQTRSFTLGTGQKVAVIDG